MPVIALVVACVALAVALVGAVSPSSAESHRAPEDTINTALSQLQTVEKNRQAMRQEIAELTTKLVEIKEASAGARGEAFDKIEIENTVRRIVGEEMAKRITQDAAAVGARVGGQPAAAQPPGAPATVAQPAAPPARNPEASFNAMLTTIQKQLALDAPKAAVVRAALTELRGELNTVFKDAEAKKIDDATRDKQAAAARAKADAEMAKALSAAEMQKLKAWRGSADPYAKRFFGL